MRRKMLFAVMTVAVLGIAVTVIVTATGRDGRTPRTSPSPSAEPGDATVRSPFTGEPVNGLGPTLAVKIDNVVAARPPTGLDRADLVYVEPVEAGLSRILAVFSSRLPDVLGPVRSARESDLELLAQFGEPAFACSGANAGVMALIHAAPVVDVSAGRAGRAYFRGDGRPAPHNLFARPDRLLEAAADASPARDIGFRFGPPPSGGVARASTTVRYGSTRIDFDWAPDKRHWTITMDGTPARTDDGTRLSAATVVVQRVIIRDSRYSDTRGVPSPYVETVGSGEAVVLRDGRAHQARWSRPIAGRGTTFTTPSGTPMTFSPGPVWIVFTA